MSKYSDTAWGHKREPIHGFTTLAFSYRELISCPSPTLNTTTITVSPLCIHLLHFKQGLGGHPASSEWMIILPNMFNGILVESLSIT